MTNLVPSRKRSRAIAIVHRKLIIREVAKARLIREIAADYGIKKPNISKHLAHDPAYRKAREKAAALRLESARRALQAVSAQRMPKSKALKAYRFALWFCQLNFPERWPVPKLDPGKMRGRGVARKGQSFTHAGGVTHFRAKA